MLPVKQGFLVFYLCRNLLLYEFKLKMRLQILAGLRKAPTYRVEPVAVERTGRRDGVLGFLRNVREKMNFRVRYCFRDSVEMAHIDPSFL